MKKTTNATKATKATTKPNAPIKSTPARAAANNAAIQEAAKALKKSPAPSRADRLSAIPPVSWEATKTSYQATLTAAAGEMFFQPKSTVGLVRANNLGVWIKRDRLPAFCDAMRTVSACRCEFLKRYPVAMFEAEIRAAQGNEAIALTTLGLSYHDDRGDALLYVPAFRAVKFLNAWLTAAANAGVTSKVRAA